MIEFLNNPPAWSAPLIATPIVIALFAVVVVGSRLLDKALRRFLTNRRESERPRFGQADWQYGPTTEQHDDN